METLLSKRRAAAMRGFPDTSGDTTASHVEWSAVEEGFRLLERDLGKLQVRPSDQYQMDVIITVMKSNLWRSMLRVFARS